MKEKIKKICDIKYHDVHGLIFVFLTETLIINNNITSYEIKPLGIIYTKYTDYYFAPLSEKYNIERIVKGYVENIEIKEEEYPHFQQ